MPTINSMMDKINGNTSKKAFRTIDRQEEAEAKRASDRVAKSKAFTPPTDECNWRRLKLISEKSEQMG